MAGQPADLPGDLSAGAVEEAALVARLVSEATGRALLPRSWTELARKGPHGCVARVALGDGKAADDTVVVKLAADAAPAAERTVLREELLIYRFLGELRPDAPFFARLMAFDDRHIVLRDLGPDSHRFAGGEEAERAAGRLLARLHRATAGHEEAFLACRALWGYPPPAADTRPWAAANQMLVFGQAARILLDWCGRALPAERQALAAHLQETEAAVRSPGVFRALVHDDFVHRRQGIVRNGEFVLLDFEFAQYFHCLADLTKMVIGSLAVEPDSGRVFFQCFDISAALFAEYRAEWRKAGGPAVDDETWMRHMTALMTFQTLTIIGRLLRGVGRNAVSPVPRLIAAVLRRWGAQVHRIDPGHSLSGTAAALAAAVAGPGRPA